MDRPEVIMRVVLVPAYQQTSLWLDPVKPVVLVWFPSLQSKTNLDARSRHRVLVVTEELAWVYLSDDTVRTGFTRFGTSSSNVLELTAEPVLNSIVEPLALQVRPVSEENNH
nr:hypothetical protein [Natrarchaeobius halalkaliphilus]